MVKLLILGTDVTNAEEVAIKLECVKTKHPQLHIEGKIYKLMQGGSMLFISDVVYSSEVCNLCTIFLFVYLCFFIYDQKP